MFIVMCFDTLVLVQVLLDFIQQLNDDQGYIYLSLILALAFVTFHL